MVVGAATVDFVIRLLVELKLVEVPEVVLVDDELVMVTVLAARVT